MANRSITIPKAHLIMALCLPLAVLLGYVLAEPMDGGTFAVITFVLVILAVPLLMNWYHPLLVLAWNLSVAPAFLPGQPSAWMIMAPVALMFAVMNRAVNPDQRFISVPSIVMPLVFFFGVLVLTACMTGGIGFRVLGASTYGSRSYFYMTMAIAGYFAFTSRRIPVEKAPAYVACFFLVTVSSLVPHLLYYLGPHAFFLFQIFPTSYIGEQVKADAVMGQGIFRWVALSAVGPAVGCFLFARYGVRGLLDLNRPWRGALFLLAVAVGALSGFRSAVVLMMLTFAALFCIEGLHRTRVLPGLLGLFVLGFGVLVPTADQLPITVQRSLAFLPLKLDLMAQHSAETSSNWRLQMWKEVLPEVPQHLLKGKGYSLDPNEVYMAGMFERYHQDNTALGTRVVGDYHNGPLSVIIPLGIFGVIGFGWFLVSSCRLLYWYARHGDPRLQKINNLMLAAFVGKMLFFLFIFGGLYSELYIFTGFVGLSVSLNGAPTEKVQEEQAETEAVEAFG
jgi:hypothetical protein